MRYIHSRCNVQTLTSHIWTSLMSNVRPSEKRFNKTRAAEIKRAAVYFKSLFSMKLGSSPFSTVIDWSLQHGKTHCWMDPRLSQAFPSSTNKEQTKTIVKVMHNSQLWNYQYTCKREHSHRWKHLWHLWHSTHGGTHFGKPDRSQMCTMSNWTLSVIHPPTRV